MVAGAGSGIYRRARVRRQPIAIRELTGYPYRGFSEGQGVRAGLTLAPSNYRLRRLVSADWWPLELERFELELPDRSFEEPDLSLPDLSLDERSGLESALFA